MSWRKNLQKLSHAQVREIVGLCSGAVLLIAAAVFLSGGVESVGTLALQNSSSQSAATVLGISQGLKSYGTSAWYPLQATPGYPAKLLCYINLSYSQYGADDGAVGTLHHGSRSSVSN
jgi:hypothetical protein